MFGKLTGIGIKLEMQFDAPNIQNYLLFHVKYILGGYPSSTVILLYDL